MSVSRTGDEGSGSIDLQELDQFNDDLVRQEIIHSGAWGGGQSISGGSSDSKGIKYYPVGGELENDQVAELVYVKPLAFRLSIPGEDSAETYIEWDFTLRQNLGAFTEDNTGTEVLYDWGTAPTDESISYTQNFGEIHRGTIVSRNGRKDDTSGNAMPPFTHSSVSLTEINLREEGNTDYGPLFFPQQDNFLGFASVFQFRAFGGGTVYFRGSYDVAWDVYEQTQTAYFDKRQGSP